MSARYKVLLAVVGWLAAITLLHLWQNTRVLDSGPSRAAHTGIRFRVGYLPVT